MNLKNVIHTGSKILIPDQNVFSPADDISRIVYHTGYKLFIFTLRTYDEHSLKEIFVPNPNLFIPGLKY